MAHSRAKEVELELQSYCRGSWMVRETGIHNKLLIRLGDALFLRERKYGRGIPKKHIENYLRIDMPDAPEMLGKTW